MDKEVLDFEVFFAYSGQACLLGVLAKMGGLEVVFGGEFVVDCW